MTCHQLRVFLAVADAGSFARGADGLRLSQPTVSQHIATLEREVGVALLDRSRSATRIDLSAVTALDTAGAWVLLGHRGMRIEAAGPAQELLLRTVKAALPPARTARPRKVRHRAGDALADVGTSVEGFLTTSAQGLGFTGLVMARLATTLVRPRRLRLTALVHHMQEVGLNAVPIVALMGFLIGVVLAFQGATQLRQFGAEVFVVDLIAVWWTSSRCRSCASWASC